MRARQVGRQALVGFVVPDARGAKDAQQPVRAELVRVSYPPGVEPTPDPDTFRRRGEVVAERAADPLRSGEALTLADGNLRELGSEGRGYTLRYGVRVRDRRGRASPLVVAPDLVLVESVPAPGNLRGEPTADGIRLLWDPVETDGPPQRYNVYRPPGPPSALDSPLNAKPLDGTEYLDTTVVTGESYTYLVRAALADGPPYRESADSGSISIVAEDRFAPSKPRGLVAVQEGRAVRLFWDPNPERDVRGYRVFRRVEREGEAARWEVLEPDPLQRPTLLDSDVTIGQRLAYRVTAVDRATPPNESEPSEVVEVHVLAEPEPLEPETP